LGPAADYIDRLAQEYASSREEFGSKICAVA
jgi:hypothetical protein